MNCCTNSPAGCWARASYSAVKANAENKMILFIGSCSCFQAREQPFGVAPINRLKIVDGKAIVLLEGAVREVIIPHWDVASIQDLRHRNQGFQCLQSRPAHTVSHIEIKFFELVLHASRKFVRLFTVSRQIIHDSMGQYGHGSTRMYKDEANVRELRRSAVPDETVYRACGVQVEIDDAGQSREIGATCRA